MRTRCSHTETADIDLTKKIREGGKLLEIQVLDHVIISDDKETFFSFADEWMVM